MGKREEQKTRWQNVLRILVDYKKTGKTFNLATAPDGTPYGRESVGEGWLPIYAFRGPYLGGDQADRRLRELRTEFGIPIEKKVHHWKHQEQSKYTYVYRLGCDPGEIDLENIRYVPKSTKVEQGILI
jgi:hypothetical protein